jgi:hypothetical protein
LNIKLFVLGGGGDAAQSLKLFAFQGLGYCFLAHTSHISRGKRREKKESEKGNGRKESTEVREKRWEEGERNWQNKMIGRWNKRRMMYRIHIHMYICSYRRGRREGIIVVVWKREGELQGLRQNFPQTISGCLLIPLQNIFFLRIASMSVFFFVHTSSLENIFLTHLTACCKIPGWEYFEFII